MIFNTESTTHDKNKLTTDTIIDMSSLECVKTTPYHDDDKISYPSFSDIEESDEESAKPKYIDFFSFESISVMLKRMYSLHSNLYRQKNIFFKDKKQVERDARKDIFGDIFK